MRLKAPTGRRGRRDGDSSPCHDALERRPDAFGRACRTMRTERFGSRGSIRERISNSVHGYPLTPVKPVQNGVTFWGNCHRQNRGLYLFFKGYYAICARGRPPEARLIVHAGGTPALPGSQPASGSGYAGLGYDRPPPCPSDDR